MSIRAPHFRSNLTVTRPVIARVRGCWRSRPARPTSGPGTGGTATQQAARIRVTSPFALVCRVFALAATDTRAQLHTAYCRAQLRHAQCAVTPTPPAPGRLDMQTVPIFGGVVGPRNWGPSKRFAQVTRCIEGTQQ